MRDKLIVLKTKVSLFYHASIICMLNGLRNANILSDRIMFKPFTRHFGTFLLDYAFLVAIGEMTLKPELIEKLTELEAILYLAR